MSEHDGSDGHGLDARLAALPRDIPPAHDLWPGIAAAITPRPSAARRWPYSIAAAVALLALGTLLSGRIARETAPAGAGGVGAPADTAPATPRAKGAQAADFVATRATLERTYRERVALLAPETRARIEADLQLIRDAQEDIRRALVGDPGSRVLLQLLQSTTEQEFNLYATVGRNTEPLESRTRT